jgi:hypothetical protein
MAQVGIDHAVAADLPKDQAVSFLQSLYVPENANSCRFEGDGISRWWKGKLPGKIAYSATYLSLEAVKGTPALIILSVRGSREAWCGMFPYSIAQKRGKDTKELTNKIFTALLSLGVTIIPASELAKGLKCRTAWCQPARTP